MEGTRTFQQNNINVGGQRQALGWGLGVLGSGKESWAETGTSQPVPPDGQRELALLFCPRRSPSGCVTLDTLGHFVGLPR